MKLHKLLSLLLVSLAATTNIQAQPQLAFPTAEGYGRYATGGRGGQTYVVTSLDDCNEGSLVRGTLRWAVKQPGKKIVTFAVCGTIYLKSALNLDCGDLTILGQTAPGDGICIADYPVTISCENAILRYLRFRLGQRQVAHHEGDGFGFNGANNVILDHCSVSWSIDECLSISAATNLTVQWCIVSQALNDAGHSKGAHGYGGNWGGTNVSFHHNLITQCNSRVPRLGGDTDATTNDYCDLRNNVFYNWGGFGCYGAEAIDVNFVNNYYKPGPNTDARDKNKTGVHRRICGIGIRTNEYVKNYPAFAHDLHKWGHFYVDGNINPEHDELSTDNWTYGIANQVDASGQDGTWTQATRDTIHLRQPREFVHVTTHPADLAYQMVLEYAGASLYRDAVDQMLVDQVERRWGDANSGTNGGSHGMIDKQSDNVTRGQLDASQVENGAWPLLLKRSQGYSDTDGDGIDDSAEDQWNLDSSDPTDGATLYKGSNKNYQGYSYVEIYIDQANKKRREWNAHCIEEGQVEGVEEPTVVCLRRMAWEHEISQLTFKGYDTKQKRQLYADGLSMDATASISGATGEDRTLKLRAQKYTIHVPTTIKAKAVKLYGYANYGNDIRVTELDGQRFATTDYVINGEGRQKQWLTVPLAKEVSGRDLTITLAGDTQPCLRIYLVEDGGTAAISNVAADQQALRHCRQAYDLNGKPVAHPTRGLYIVDGKKITIR